MIFKLSNTFAVGNVGQNLPFSAILAIA